MTTGFNEATALSRGSHVPADPAAAGGNDGFNEATALSRGSREESGETIEPGSRFNEATALSRGSRPRSSPAARWRVSLQ